MSISAEAGQKPEVMQGAGRAVASLASAQDWRLVMPQGREIERDREAERERERDRERA